jgi:hypothetical protein
MTTAFLIDSGTLDFPLHRWPVESGFRCVLHINHTFNYEHIEDKIEEDRLFNKGNDSVGVHGGSILFSIFSFQVRCSAMTSNGLR